ncbi:MAG: tyrosine-type recombinase/integrase [Lachnospiraceae bacterium]
MKGKLCCQQVIGIFKQHLMEEEKSNATIAKYVHDIEVFNNFLGNNQPITKERVMAYKDYLGNHYKITSANSMLAALNRFLGWMGLGDCRVKSFKYQRQMFSDQNRELNKQEYERLIEAARTTGNIRLEMIMQTICSTGIRISELPYITVNSLYKGRAEVYSKGKHRIVFIVPQLRKYLLYYCNRQGIKKGTVFVSRSGRPVNRIRIWSEMKNLAVTAKVAAEKIFPHNLRHLFARLCYQKKKDIVYLADILGHCSVETTRIYTMSSGKEHEMMLSSLGLVI